MKFLIDECISRSVYLWLKENFDTKYICDIMPSVTDDQVLEYACSENRIIITRDKDFGDIIFRDKKQHKGVILLRLHLKHPANQLAILQKVMSEYETQLDGNFIIATDYSIKVIQIS